MSVELVPPKAEVAKIEEQRVTRDSEILADAAKRIMREDVYLRATSGLRTHYLEQLAKAEPNDMGVIIQLQATIRAIDGLNSELLKFAMGAALPRQSVI